MPSVLALIVTYQPGPSLVELARVLSSAGLDVLVVDNASTDGLEHLQACGQQGARVARLPENTGVAGGLAHGLVAAGAAYEWLLTFDQDSRLDEVAVAALTDAAERAGADVAMIGAVVVDEGSGRVLQGPSEQAALITSGTVCRVAALTAVGGFRPELFIDFVDYDVCLRLRRAGWRLRVEPAATLQHSVGRLQEHRVAGVPVRSTHHSADRHYYRYRNFVLLARDGTLRSDPRWSARVALALGWAPLKVLTVQQQRASTLAAIGAGVRDGVRGRVGPRPAPDRGRRSLRRR